MCKKQTSASRSSIESEIISLDGGLRMDGLPALDLCDIVVEVLRTTNDNIQPGHTSSGKLAQIQPKHQAYPPTHVLLKGNLSCTSLKTTKP